MAWSGGRLAAGFTGLPDVTGGTTSSARLSGRHSQSLHNAVSRSAQSSVFQRTATIAARGAQVALTAAATTSSDAKLQKLQSETSVQFSAVGLPNQAFSNVSPALQSLAQPGAEPPSTPGYKSKNSETQGSGKQQGSSRVMVEYCALPPEVVKLGDPSITPQLPNPSAVYSRLDNRELDKLVSALGRNKATWRRSLLLYNWLKDCGHSLDDRLCTTLIRVLAEHGAWNSAAEVYKWMKAPVEAGGAGLKPTVYTYTAAMRAALSANVLDVAMQVWKDSQDAGCQPDCRLCITYIEVCSRLQQVQPALEMYEHMKNSPPDSKMAPTVHAYTAAMRAATEGGMWQKALEIWNDMKHAMCAPTGHAFAAVISACAAGMDWVTAVSLFEEMCSSGIQPDVVSCTALITALAAAGQWQQAEHVVQWMLRHGLRPNVRTYTALLTALGNAKQWERAVEMLQLMQQPAWGSVSPNAYTYSALLKSLGEHGLWKLAEQVFSQLEKDTMTPSRAAALARPPPPPPPVPSPAAIAATNMQALVPSPAALASINAASSSTPRAPLAQALPSLGDLSNPWQTWTSPAQLNGLHLFESLQPVPVPAGMPPPPPPPPPPAPAPTTMGQPTTAPSVATSGITTSASPSGSPISSASSSTSTRTVLCSVPTADGAVSAADLLAKGTRKPIGKPPVPAHGPHATTVHHHVLSKGHGDPKIVNEVVCGALMLAYERAGKWDEAVRVLSRARALGIEPNTVMYNTAISAAGKALQLDLAEQLFQEMQHPDAVTFETLIVAYGMGGLPVKAEAMLGSMMTRGFRPRDYAYCGLIAAYSVSGDLQSALNVRNRLFAQGGLLTVHVYNSLLAACERAGQWDKQLDLYRMMQAEGVEPNHFTLQLVSSATRRTRGVQQQQQQPLNPLDAIVSSLDPVLAAALSAYAMAANAMTAAGLQALPTGP